LREKTQERVAGSSVFFSVYRSESDSITYEFCAENKLIVTGRLEDDLTEGEHEYAIRSVPSGFQLVVDGNVLESEFVAGYDMNILEIRDTGKRTCSTLLRIGYRPGNQPDENDCREKIVGQWEVKEVLQLSPGFYTEYGDYQVRTLLYCSDENNSVYEFRADHTLTVTGSPAYGPAEGEHTYRIESVYNDVQLLIDGDVTDCWFTPGYGMNFLEVTDAKRQTHTSLMRKGYVVSDFNSPVPTFEMRFRKNITGKWKLLKHEACGDYRADGTRPCETIDYSKDMIIFEFFPDNQVIITGPLEGDWAAGKHTCEYQMPARSYMTPPPQQMVFDAMGPNFRSGEIRAFCRAETAGHEMTIVESNQKWHKTLVEIE